MSRSIYVGESNAEARKHAVSGTFGRSFEYIRTIIKSLNMLNILKHNSQVADEEVTLDYLLKHLCIIGDPDSCIRQLLEVWEQTGGFGTLLMTTHDWDDKDKWVRSMELLAREGTPSFAGKLMIPKNKDNHARRQLPSSVEEGMPMATGHCREWSIRVADPTTPRWLPPALPLLVLGGESSLDGLQLHRSVEDRDLYRTQRLRLPLLTCPSAYVLFDARQHLGGTSQHERIVAAHLNPLHSFFHPFSGNLRIISTAHANEYVGFAKLSGRPSSTTRSISGWSHWPV